MGAKTMSIALPDELRAWIESRVQSGQYGNSSEYLRDLIRRDHDAHVRARLRELIVDGLASGPAQPYSRGDAATLRRRLVGRRR
jgi:antitoxin ParD1/3/4